MNCVARGTFAEVIGRLHVEHSSRLVRIVKEIFVDIPAEHWNL